MTWCAGLALAGALTGVLAGCGQSSATGSWGEANEVPGLAALNTGGDADVASVSCASEGNCAAGGSYKERHDHRHGFVAVEQNGGWGQAIEVPGLAALSTGGGADVGSVSCASSGSCVAVGSYTDGDGGRQGFVAIETNGGWGRAIEVPGLGTLNKGGNASVASLSCVSAGNCLVGGFYTAGDSDRRGFVAVEQDGRWSQAIEVPGLAVLSTGGNASVTSVSCASPGNCAAGGSYRGRGFVASERSGRWDQPIEVPGLAALNTGRNEAGVASISCASPGNCAAGGSYTNRHGSQQGYVVVEKNDRWGQAIEVPGLGALNDGGQAGVASISCASPGNCAAGGDVGFPYASGFVASERNGVWGQAIPVNGLTLGRYTDIFSVSCAPAGNCAAGGDYEDTPYGTSGYVTSEKYGHWAPAVDVPGLRALDTKAGYGASVYSVSCPPAGSCAAGGDYTDGHGREQGFLTWEPSPPAGARAR